MAWKLLFFMNKADNHHMPSRLLNMYAVIHYKLPKYALKICCKKKIITKILIFYIHYRYNENDTIHLNDENYNSCPLVG